MLVASGRALPVLAARPATDDRPSVLASPDDWKQFFPQPDRRVDQGLRGSDNYGLAEPVVCNPVACVGSDGLGARSASDPSLQATYTSNRDRPRPHQADLHRPTEGQRRRPKAMHERDMTVRE
jgi:hypothetical protein